VLQRWRRAQTTEREAWGSDYADPVDADGTPYGLVFSRENGEPLDPDKTYATFVRLVRGAGLSHVKLHGLRHLNISLQLEAGVSKTVIAMRVGHTSPALIRSTYGHLTGTIGQRAAEATAALVPRSQKERSQQDETVPRGIAGPSPQGVREWQTDAEQPERSVGSPRDPQVRSPTIPQQIAPNSYIDRSD
jgi:hypothetical protein